MKPFQVKIRPEDVRELIDFGLPGEQGQSRYASMATLQAEGVAAIYNILCRLDFAYLADEVGMGKTYQALGLAAVLWNLKPDARIVFVSPRANLQTKWIRDYTNFIQNNYRKPQGSTGDAILKCVLRGKPLILPETCNNLREFARSLAMPGRKVWFLRHTSFQRPLCISPRDDSELPGIWEECRRQMKVCGLWDFGSHLPCRTADKASRFFNMRFAHALKKRLQDLGADGEPAIDLLVIDEAQCLRHSDNQGNTLLREALQGNVGKWLFLSATPIHTGRTDVQTQVNEYVQPGFISADEVSDADRLMKKMKEFLVRRPRKFVIDTECNTELAKHQYRDHQKKPAKSEDPFAALTMALVQKKLASILEGRNNRFRIGFLSSFESLQESIQRDRKTEGDDQEGLTDFYIGKDEVVREESERIPADWDFVTSLDRRFKAQFGEDKYLPHPKLDHTVDLLAQDAFESNRKFLVFCRRIRAVEELRRRLDRRWHQWIEQRILDVWGVNLDWRGQETQMDPEEASGYDPETLDALPEDAGFRNANRKGEWLANYRLTFRDAGRNALVFQENWLMALCGVTGLDIEDVVENLPEDLFQEALAATTREYSGRLRLYPAECLAYIATVLVRRNPTRIGLNDEHAQVWARFLSTINAPLLGRERSNRPVQTNRRLLKNVGFWDMWRARFADPNHPLHLGLSSDIPIDDLYRREIIKNLIGQSYRLTDVLLDLYFAEKGAEGEPEQFLTRFFDYLTGDSPYACSLRERTAGWIAHFPVVLLNCFRSERNLTNLANMAATGWYSELNNQTAVVSVTGGSAINETAIRQFKTPFYPQIIVCTDVLKEGEDLHVFCDQVVHYGIAWTSGDLEQRIGRVDRFFSQIERRLCETKGSPDVKLGIYYPYLEDTLEKWQIDRVHARVRDAEKILDNFELSTHDESKDIVLDTDLESRTLARVHRTGNDHPFADISRHIPARGRKIVSQNRQDGQHLAESFREGGRLIEDYLNAHGMIFEDELTEDLSFYARIPQNGNTIRYRFEWDFIHDLFVSAQGAYALRILQSVPENAVWGDKFSFAYERREEKRTYGWYRTHRVVFHRAPSPEDIRDTFAQVVSYLGEDHVSVESDAVQLDQLRKWLKPIPSLTHQNWVKSHKAELTFNFADTQQHANLYAYRNMLLIVSPVANVDDLDDAWFGPNGNRGQRIRDWCLDQNRQLSLGFLHVNSEGALNFCERLFVDRLDDADFQNIIRTVVFRADMYETFLTGNDDH